MGLLNRKSNEYSSSTENAPLTGHHQAYNAGASPTGTTTAAPVPGTATSNPYSNGNAVLEKERGGYGGIFHKNKHDHLTHTTGAGHNNGPLGGGGRAGGYDQAYESGNTGVGTGIGADTGMFGRHHDAAPAPVAGAGHVNTGPAPLHGVSSGATPSVKAAHKLERKGKMESTMGSLLCNSSLKHKSEAHLAQADHMRMQASELSEAERLEREAGMRRQRAVGLGADPVHAQGVTGHGPLGGAGVGHGHSAQVA
ncbi:hypothetical protein I316_07686 [Kwoniella heveanensis BCC8398]|uniref:Uncharacterized protein n=1 Tax=Kwoniella heveanensis BCC8398 TaxID=1296120 RepID=A0A1B9GHZ5_9TREE|nr:hypothetical protein I316_07686 [Kwoniella heveanensis BCC8398]